MIAPWQDVTETVRSETPDPVHAAYQHPTAPVRVVIYQPYMPMPDEEAPHAYWAVCVEATQTTERTHTSMIIADHAVKTQEAALQLAVLYLDLIGKGNSHANTDTAHVADPEQE
jgi:hypothetical protein